MGSATTRRRRQGGVKVVDLGAWLDDIGLGDCHALFAQHDIDADVLRDLTDQDLEQIGLSLGKRRKLLRAIATLDSPAAATPPLPASPISASPISASPISASPAPAPLATAPPASTPSAQPRSERRQVTVLFCDLVGSTELSMHLDPEDLQQVLRRSLDIIAATVQRFGGYVAKFMGDGVLVYFGWPQAHEDSAEQAARSGLALVEALAAAGGETRLKIRVGMATGLVVVGEVLGEGAAREHVITGATANLAARLQASAAPDTVVIAPSTRKLLGSMFELAPTGPLTLKGVEGPVEAFTLLRENASDSRFEALRAAAACGMVGRTEELALLQDCWHKAAAGSGQVLLLSGEAGIGKTHLVEAFVEAITEPPPGPPHLRLRWQCMPHHGTTALHPIIHAARRRAGFEHDDSDQTRREKLGHMLETLGLQGPEALALFTSLLSLDTAATAQTQLDPTARKQRQLAQMVEILGHLAGHQPLLLQVEDAHWADPTTLELCDLIVARAPRLRLMMILTSRPEFLPGWPDAPHTHQIALARLGAADAAEMLRRVIGERPLPAGLAAQILGKTDGMPLYIEELTKELLETATSSAGDPSGPDPAAATLSIPATLQDSLTARLDRLGWVKEVAQTAAVIGRNFTPPLLEPLLALPADRLSAALQAMVDANLVTLLGSPSTGTYSFRHALIFDAAYAGLLLSERRRLHSSIAHLLEERFTDQAQRQPEMLAHHLTEAREPLAAAAWWRKAGRRSTDAGAFSEAATQLGRALEQLAQTEESQERDVQESRIRVDLVTPLSATDGYHSERVRANFERLVTLYKRNDEDYLLPALGGQLGIAYGGSYMIRAVALGEQLVNAAEQSGDRSNRIFARWTMGMALTGRGSLVPALEMLESALAISIPEEDAALAHTQLSNPRNAALAYKALVLHQLGYPDQALAISRQCIEEATALGHSMTLGIALTLSLSLHLLRQDREALVQTATALAEHATKQESRPLMAVAGAVLGLLRAETDPNDAIFNQVHFTIGVLRSSGWHLMVGWLGLLEARICLAHNRIDTARQNLFELHAVIEPRGHDFFVPELYRLLAAVALHDGDPTIAEAHLHHSMAMAHSEMARMAELRAATDLARLWSETGKTSAAIDLLAPLIAWFTEGADCTDQKEARALLASLTRPARRSKAAH